MKNKNRPLPQAALYAIAVACLLLAASLSCNRQSTPTPELTGEQMAAILLSQEEVAAEFSALLLTPESSGILDNAQTAVDDTLNPDDTGADIAAAGRTTGYIHTFQDPQSPLDNVGEDPFEMRAIVHLLEDEKQATDFLSTLTEEFTKFEDVPVDQGTVSSVSTLDHDTLGEESTFFRAELTPPESETAAIYWLLWKRGATVLEAGAFAPATSAIDHSSAVLRLTAIMDGRAKRTAQ